MFISESPLVVSPVQKKINRSVESSLKNLREQKIWMTFCLIVFSLDIESLTGFWVAEEAPLVLVPERGTNFLVQILSFKF